MMANEEIRDLAHELRTPLTSILGFTELLLEDGSMTAQQREYLAIILDESVRISEMISERVNKMEAAAIAPDVDLPVAAPPEK